MLSFPSSVSLSLTALRMIHSQFFSIRWRTDGSTFICFSLLESRFEYFHTLQNMSRQQEQPTTPTFSESELKYSERLINFLTSDSQSDNVFNLGKISI
ncbi:hypothetical protein B9Z55_005368 [Caenorhabditis nigoni]|uniref:Uncharacterized protein n=1 Tax=Caenorhabditis nigoni TaxID=1611254 RepID=A0A2G5V0J5_9PELO|nr:hypothetical protein B9Z55_005368 [Caenorhabditis nigoni]